MITEKIGFIGSGQIAGSLAVGFTRAGLVDGKQIYASDPFEGSRSAFAKMVPGSTLMDDNRRLAAEVDVLFLAVKPQFISDVLDGRAGAGAWPVSLRSDQRDNKRRRPLHDLFAITRLSRPGSAQSGLRFGIFQHAVA